MAKVTGLTADRMLAIEAASVVSGHVAPTGDLLLETHGGSEINAGRVVAPMLLGLVSIWGGSYLNVPEGWLWCNGQALSRSAYPEAFAIIGTQWGVGDGSTTFNIPDFSGRTAVGMDDTQTEFSSRGKTGGSKTVTLTTAQMPSHTHIQNAHTHTQNAHTHTQNAHNHFSGSMPNGGPYKTADGTYYNVRGASSTTSGADAGNTLTSTATNQNTTAVNQNTTAVNQSTGGDGAHNNLQPYLTVNYIIFVGSPVTP